MIVRVVDGTGYGVGEPAVPDSSLRTAVGPQVTGQRNSELCLTQRLTQSGDDPGGSVVQTIDDRHQAGNHVLTECAGRYLGVAVASTAHLIDVSAVVLGGHFAVLAEWIRPSLHDSLATCVPGMLAERDVAVSELAQSAALMGAADGCLQDVLARPYELNSATELPAEGQRA